MSDIFMMACGMKIQINLLCATLVAPLILGKPVRAGLTGIQVLQKPELEALSISLLCPFALTNFKSN